MFIFLSCNGRVAVSVVSSRVVSSVLVIVVVHSIDILLMIIDCTISLLYIYKDRIIDYTINILMSMGDLRARTAFFKFATRIVDNPLLDS